MNTTVIVTSYCRPEALELVLQSLAKQVEMPYEVIVADDGSGPDVCGLVDRWSQFLPLSFIWQADLNFRAARARNLAALKAKGEHLVFIDGDCVLPPDFVRAHRSLVCQRKIVSGGRFLMNSSETEALVGIGHVEPSVCFSGTKFLKIPLGFLRDASPRNWRSVRTANLGVMKSDFMDVGGFDESYQGWGREDSDLVVRMINNGVKIRSARFAACVSHLYHNEEPKTQLAANDHRFEDVFSNQLKVAPVKTSIYSQ